MKKLGWILGISGMVLALVPFLIILFLWFPEKDEDGFIRIFNGHDLNGWDGDPDFWRIEKGILTGETTPAHPLEHSSYILWRERKIENFELKLEFRLTGGNSGVQYRTLDGDSGGERWTDVRGYQADLEDGDKWSGILYEVGMRKFLALRGEEVVVRAGEKPEVVGKVGDPEELQEKIRRDDWNEYHIIAQGNYLVHLINGTVMVKVTDEDGATRIKSGYIGFQVHQGPPMKIELRNIRLREFPQTETREKNG